jgi:regulatory protein
VRNASRRSSGQSRLPEDRDSFQAAYSRALRWLTARELSTAQVRSRLSERGFSEAATSAAIQRLLDDRTLDDRRAARAVARTEARIRRHGPRRIMSKLLSMQIDRDLAREIVREQFGDEDEQQLLETTLDRRLRGKPERVKDPGERRKLLAYLVRQGFSASAASNALRKRSKR